MTRTIVLIACGAKKLDKPARAGDIYQGSLFKKAKEAALIIGDDYRIISAKHGVLCPDDRIAPYDAALKTAGGDVEPALIGKRVASWLAAHRVMDKESAVIALLPSTYASVLPLSIPNLMPRGLPIGKMMAFLSDRERLLSLAERVLKK